jgi:hypothetical protein
MMYVDLVQLIEPLQALFHYVFSPLLTRT